ncbi:MAG: GDSL-type esterase/lipase family protein [Asticcacaulis sp.]
MDRRRLMAGGLVAGGSLLAGRVMAQAAPAVTQAQGTDISPSAPPQPSDAAARVAQTPQPQPTPPPPPQVASFDWPNLHRYRDANSVAATLPRAARRVVMMGDSITDNWAKPEYGNGFFDAHGMIGRGISGQVTAQMLVRFTPDVLALKPQVVHIMAGTNDIAENQDPYDFTATTGNLQAMITLAKAARLRIILASVPPATSFSWKPYRGNQIETIRALNEWIKAACARQGLIYCDYWPVLQGPDGGLKPELGINGDSVHPNAAGYAAMAPVLQAAVAAAIGV